MHYLAILILFLSSAASAAEIIITIPAGAAITKLLAVCDLLKIEFEDPAMTNEECARIFLLRGAREYFIRLTDNAKSAEKSSELAAERATFDAALPLPEPPEPVEP